MIHPPRVSIVVPAYNLERFIGACLASVLAQSCTDWECLVIDDGSADATAARVSEAAQRSGGRIRLVTQANGGVSTARNNGLHAAQGACVMFLDGDDLLHPEALARLLAALDSQPAAVLAFGTFVKVNEDGSTFAGQKPLHLHRYPSGDVLADIVRDNFFANGGHVLIRAEAAVQAGGFNTRLRLSEDWDFWVRLALRGQFHFIGCEPEVFRLRMRLGSSSRNLAADWANHLPTIEAVLGNAELQARFSPQAWRRLSRQVMASHLWEAGRVNFVARRFREARRLMLASLRHEMKPKRVAMFGIAQLSQLTNRSYVSRLRFEA
jgi:glycosyltransferase involved in cell wall biosynthesis